MGCFLVWTISLTGRETQSGGGRNGELVQKRSEPFQEGRDFLFVEQSRGDEELARSIGDQGRIGLQQALDFAVRASV